MLDCKVINKFHDGHILPLILLQKISLLPLGRIKKIRIFTKHKNKKKKGTIMVLIANPIYDSVFKYMMEDERVAKIMLSALLQKEVIKLEMRPHEYTGVTQRKISMMRIDFAATIRNEDGSIQLILIELQKTWLVTETLRFRQYLGSQYIDKKNVPDKNINPKGYGLPIVSIYILGHKLGELQEPVVYVRRKYLDYNSNPIETGVPDPFIESLTHDSIIIQIPYLKGKVRNKLERLLQVFDQSYCVKDNEHIMEIDESGMEVEEQLVVDRLIKAAVEPEVRRDMDVEDEILSEIESRDTTIMMKNREIELMNQELNQKDQELNQKDQELNQKDQELNQKSNMLTSMISLFKKQGMTDEKIAKELNITPEELIKLLK